MTGLPAPLGPLGKNGRYRLIEEIGAGAMASVYRAEDTLLRRDVAVKMLYRHLLRDPAGKARFLREARAAAGLDHPGILKVFDVGETDDGSPFIVMELLRGRSLKAVLEDGGPPLAEIVALCGAALAEALAVAHEAGVVHRDVKPANVMVCTGGRVVLCDFGVARVADDDALATQTGALVGTPAFMSPEQATGRKADARSDIYGLGATLYQMATGAPPWTGSAAAVLQHVVKGDAAPPARKNPLLGSELSALILRAMAREPEARPASAADLARALADFAAASGCASSELGVYFDDPGGWSERTKPRILDATMTRARAAVREGKVARALSLAERVLAFDPAHPAAASLVASTGVAARRGRQATWLLLAAGAVAAAGLTLAALRYLPRHGAAVLPDAAPLAGTIPDAAPLAVTIPDAAPLASTVPDVPDAAAPKKATVRRPPVRLAAPDAGTETASVAPPLPPPAAAPATLEVRIRPWCDIEVDGTAHGRSPGAPPITLPPGHHHLVCKQPRKSFERDLDLAPGAREVVREQLYADVAVQVAVARARIDGAAVTRGATIELSPGTHSVEIGDAAAVFVPIGTRPCILKDTPELGCYESP